MATLEPGMPVRLVAGRYKGSYGTVVRLTPCQVYVRVEGVEDRVVRKYQTSVVIVGDQRNNSEQPNPTRQLEPGQNNTETRQNPRVVTPPGSQSEDDRWSLLSTTSPPVRNISLCDSETDSDDDGSITGNEDSLPEESVDDSFVTTTQLVPYDQTIHPAGTPASVVGGTYLGRRGSIVRPTSCMVYVLLSEPMMEVRIRQNNVSVITTALQRTARPAPDRGAETKTTTASSQQQSEITHTTVDFPFDTVADSVTSIESDPAIVTPESSDAPADAPSRTVEESLPRIEATRLKDSPTKMFLDAIDVISLSSQCSSATSMVTTDLYHDAVESIDCSEESMFEDSDDASVSLASYGSSDETMATVETEFEDAIDFIAPSEQSTHATSTATMETAEPEFYGDALHSVASSETSMYMAVSGMDSESTLSSTEYHCLSEEYDIVAAQTYENEIERASEANKYNQVEFALDSKTDSGFVKSHTTSSRAKTANTGRSERQTKATMSSQKRLPTEAPTRSGSSNPRDARRKDKARVDDPKGPQEQPRWRVEGFGSTPHSFSGVEVDKVALLSSGSLTNKQRTFAQLLFGNRVLSTEVPVSRSVDGTSNDISPTVDWNGRIYELLTSKVQKEGKKNYYGPRMRVSLQYVAVSGQDLTSTIDLQEELNKVANFGSLKPHKAAARLELLQSPAAKSNIKKRDFLILDNLTSAVFELIPEDSCAGCGFVPKSFIHELLGHHAVGKRTNALQVRIFAPRLGIFKGMLEVKPGIDRIQLPPSMRKVPPSLVSGEDWACLLVTQKFPSTVNLNVAKLLRSEPTPDGFKKVVKGKRLKPMIPHIWKGLGVPSQVSQRYVKDSAEREHLKHAFVVGVADSTGFIPEGHVYVPGMGDAQRDNLFVTRCPCTELQDGHLLPVVTSKPLDMPDAMWTSLTESHFGKIIFGNSHGGRRTLPELIANGDLDGDPYFICWSEQIISNVHPVQMAWPKAVVQSEQPESVSDNQTDWLPATQVHMVNFLAFAELNLLFEKLHNQTMKKADKSPLGIDDPDCRPLGRAYKKSLDLGKHGGILYLPAHLWELIPERLHKYLTTKEQEEQI